MSSDNNSSGCLGFIVFVLIVFAIYVVYLLAIWLIKIVPVTFVFLGFNSFFFMDNLFEIPVFNPVIVWGIIGLFVGSILGFIIAIKKLKLNSNIVLYPVVTFVVLIIILGLVNSPFNHDVKIYEIPKYKSSNTETIKISFYKTTTKVDVRIEPSRSGKKLFSLKKGEIVELVSTEFKDSKNITWYKIIYNNKEGFVEEKYLSFHH